MTDKRRRAATVCLIVVFFILLSFFMTRPVLTRGDEGAIVNPYDPMLQSWTLAWDTRELTRNPFNLFNANIYFPNSHTLAYTDHQVVNAVLAAPFLAITDNPMQSANLLLIFQFFLCSLGAYLLTTHLTGNRPAGVVAGIAFSYAPYKIAHLAHLNLCSAAWIPLCILFLHKYSKEKKTRDVILFALFFVLQALTALYYAIMLAIAIGLFLLVRFFTYRETFNLKWLLKIAAALVCAFLIILPFLLPYFQVSGEEPNFERSIAEVDFYSSDIQDFLLAPKESFLWGKASGYFREDAEKRGNPVERSIFPGLVPLVLGIGGIVYLYRRRKREREKSFNFWYYSSLLFVSVIFCLGTSLYVFGHRIRFIMPYDLFYYLVPGFKAMRVPARFAILTALALAVLSGFAVKGILEWLRSKDFKRNIIVTTIVVAAVVSVLVVDLMPVYLPIYQVPPEDDFPVVYKWLKSQEGDTPIVEVPLATYDPGAYFGVETDVSWVQLESWRVYYSTLHWKKMVNGFSGFIPLSYSNASKACRDFPSSECICFFEEIGVEYMIVHGEEVGEAAALEMDEWAEEHREVEQVARFGPDRVYRFILEAEPIEL